MGFRRRVATPNGRRAAGGSLAAVPIPCRGTEWQKLEFELELQEGQVAFREPIDFSIRWMPHTYSDLNLLVGRAFLFPQDEDDGIDPDVVALVRNMSCPSSAFLAGTSSAIIPGATPSGRWICGRRWRTMPGEGRTTTSLGPVSSLTSAGRSARGRTSRSTRAPARPPKAIVCKSDSGSRLLVAAASRHPTRSMGLTVQIPGYQLPHEVSVSVPAHPEITARATPVQPEFPLWHTAVTLDGDTFAIELPPFALAWMIAVTM